MSATFRLEIVTPTAYYELDQVEYLRAPGYDGLFGVEAGHAPALIALTVGELKVVSGGKDKFWATSGGYAEIDRDNVKLLLETVEQADKVDRDRAQHALERAQQRLKDKTMDEERARSAMLRALNRLKVSSH